MKQKILLTFVICCFITAAYAQKNQKTTAYAITGIQKGQNNWSEVRLVDITTGEEVKTIFQSSQQAELLNARTGKPVVKKDYVRNELMPVQVRIMRDNRDASQLDPTGNVRIVKKDAQEKINLQEKAELEKKLLAVTTKISSDNPFATSSAACAYDKKHERLYYTPMGISQLRYIDLKAGSPKIYYFEDEPFGVLKSSRDVPNQITRMVIASDGNGYALTNDANHLIQFTTGKKPVITDLGMLTDDAANGKFSVHNANGYGGDMIADAQKNLYLVTANHNVYKISLENRVAQYLGAIQGLPRGFTTNGAMAEGGSQVIVCSSNSTQGYYRFDLTTLQSEKVSGESAVYNASDLANGILAFDKKKKDKKHEIKPVDAIPQPDVVLDEVPAIEQRAKRADAISEGSISVFPNPVTNGVVKLSFDNQPMGRYQVQFMDISGKIIGTTEVTISQKAQVHEFRLPKVITAGNYLVKVVSDVNHVSVVNKLVIEQ
jgi:hypothetical protein